MHQGMNIYGMATIGTKGQIVIPAEARTDMGFKEGDKVFVIGLKEKGVIGVIPVANMDAWMEKMSRHLNYLKNSVEDGKKEEKFED
jgi:AbrB family looped-hinge helix DNA binding protein